MYQSFIIQHSTTDTQKQVAWWQMIQDEITDPVKVITVYIRKTYIQLLELAESIRPRFYQIGFQQLFGQWLAEKPSLMHQDVWTSKVIVRPCRDDSDPIEQLQNLTTFCVTHWWFRQLHHCAVIDYAAHEHEQLLQSLETLGWEIIPKLPAIAAKPVLLKRIARKNQNIPFLGNEKILETSAPVAVQSQDATRRSLISIQRDTDVSVRSLEESPIVIGATDSFLFKIGVSHIGETVSLRWKAMRLTLVSYIDIGMAISFLVSTVDQLLLGDTGIPLIAVLPTAYRNIQYIELLRQRVRFIDADNLQESTGFPIEFLDPHAVKKVFAAHGIVTRNEESIDYTHLARWLHSHNGHHLATKAVIGLLVPQDINHQQDELITVLRQVGGIVLFGDETDETRFLADMLWLIAEAAYQTDEIPLCLISHADILPPAQLQQHALHIQINPTTDIASHTHVELRAGDGQWMLRDYTGAVYVLDEDLEALSTDETQDVREQLRTAFADLDIPIRTSPHHELLAYFDEDAPVVVDTPIQQPERSAPTALIQRDTGIVHPSDNHTSTFVFSNTSILDVWVRTDAMRYGFYCNPTPHYLWMWLRSYIEHSFMLFEGDPMIQFASPFFYRYYMQCAWLGDHHSIRRLSASNPQPMPPMTLSHSEEIHTQLSAEEDVLLQEIEPTRRRKRVLGSGYKG